jgi:hypothetical protein
MPPFDVTRSDNAARDDLGSKSAVKIRETRPSSSPRWIPASCLDQVAVNEQVEPMPGRGGQPEEPVVVYGQRAVDGRAQGDVGVGDVGVSVVSAEDQADMAR